MKFKLWAVWSKPSETDAMTTLYSADDIAERLNGLPRSIADAAAQAAEAGKSGEVVNVTIQIVIPEAPPAKHD